MEREIQENTVEYSGKGNRIVEFKENVYGTEKIIIFSTSVFATRTK